MLAARDLAFAIADRQLLDAASLTIDDGERVALVGRNGAGKSTFLNLLAGTLAPDAGLVERGRCQKLGLLAQTPQLDRDATVAATARAALGEVSALIAEHARLAEEAPDDPRQSELLSRIDDLGGFDVEHRIDEVLTRLGVRDLSLKVASLSGGERRRLDLARLLLAAPDILLLDEPTNHLDVAGIAFLAGELTRHRGPVLLVSHDRSFIDAVGTRVVELEAGKLYSTLKPKDGRGLVDAYLEDKLLRDEQLERESHRRRRLYVRELAWLRAGTPARTTKQQARIQRAQALADEVEDQAQHLRDKRARVSIDEVKGARLGRTILACRGLALGRGERTHFSRLDLALTVGQRWGIVGDNGAGKTTLLTAILTAAGLVDGERAVRPQAGTLELGKNTRVALFDQHRASLDPEATLEEILAGENDHVFIGPKDGEQRRVHIASYLEQFLFDGSDRYRRVKTLSGGQQNRLALARLFQQGANCLLLDEPTNDLDVETLVVLEEALLSLDGCALIVSHDRRFLDRVATGILCIEGGKATAWPGDYTNFERLHAQQAGVETEVAPPVSPKDEVELPARRERTGKRKRTYKEERELCQMEETILAREAKKEELSLALSSGEIFKTDAARGRAMTEELAALDEEIPRLYSRWAELAELLPP
ncbi:MAG: ABC-F family ATP-binding cassette domain-containing protein [Deltaproteobacteria bacterium]|nr:ABC-F family ATP-binding cassette domain-containing protein [Deltaproteobacteria bacterium]